MKHPTIPLKWLAAALLTGLLVTGGALAHGNGHGYGKRPFYSDYRAVPHHPARHHGDYRRDGHRYRRHGGHGYRHSGYRYQEAYRQGYRDGRRHQSHRYSHHHRHGISANIGYRYANQFRWCDDHRGYYRLGDYYDTHY